MKTHPTAYAIRSTLTKFRQKRRFVAFGALLLLIVLVTSLIYIWNLGRVEINGDAEEKLGAEDESEIVGLAVINTERYEYEVGEKVNMKMAMVDEEGRVLCDEEVEVKVTNIDGDGETVEKEMMAGLPTATCNQGNVVTNNPDYTVDYITQEAGTYALELTGENGEAIAEAEMIVNPEVLPVSLSRWSAVRNVEGERYPMVIEVTANENFKGMVSDSMPANYEYAWVGEGKVEGQEISWQVELGQGETVELKYEYVNKTGLLGVNQFGPMTARVGEEIVEGNEWRVISQVEG
jgi:hypothetical protein